jgi:Cdc6-like AAA superfamily ATPase
MTDGPVTSPRRPLKRRHSNAYSSGPSTDSSDSCNSEGNRYEKAKCLLHRSAQVRVVGRTVERAFISRFWTATINRHDAAEPRVMYICGNPGTGKTALIEEMLPELLLESPAVQLIKANCMMQSDPRDVLDLIAQQLKIAKKKIVGDRHQKLLASIETTLSRRKTPIVIVLDEVDQIAVKDSALLESIFRLPYTVLGQSVTIIGIANALDLSIRYFNAPPSEVVVLNFAPYSPEDIARILMARLELANATAGQENQHSGIISNVAIEMCARKVSAVGDLRKALEIMREAITLAEKDAAPRVDMSHVTRAIERVFGATVRTTSRHAQLIGELNLHQKLLLATLFRLCKESPSLKPTVQLLFDRYTFSVRAHRIIDAVGRSEFHDLIANAESMGVIALIAPGKRLRSSTGAVTPDTKVLLSIPADDVSAGLSNNPVLQALL